jgi:HisJ family histidinol phosphate phosphatase
MLDYHVHLWPHAERAEAAGQRLERLASYCELAAERGVSELAFTEHLFRFTAASSLVDSVRRDETDPARRSSIAAYFAHHTTADLDSYVEAVVEAKRAGLPVVLGLEVDFYRGRMDDVARLLAGYPFDVLLGSVHWIGGWMFDVLDDPAMVGEWDARGVERAWRDYTASIEELAATRTCDVLAHPDLAKVAGRRPDRGLRAELEERMALAAARSSMAAELSSAGWRKPAAEAYPSASLLSRFAAHGVPLTTASDTHGTALVGERAGELAQLASAAGYERLRAFRQRVGHDVALESSQVTAGRPDTAASARRGATTAQHSAESRSRPARPAIGDLGGHVASPSELARRYTGLDLAARKHLERLVASWGLLADLSFSDLLCYVPIDENSLAVAAPGVLGAEPSAPADGDARLGDDLLGPVQAAPGQPGAAPAGPTGSASAPSGGGSPGQGLRGLHFVVLGQVRPSTSQTMFQLDLVGQVVAANELPVVSDCWLRGAVTLGERPAPDGVLRVQCVPVRWAGEVVAVLARVWSPDLARRTGGLERTYVQLFQRLALMVSTGHFPFLADETEIEESPRVGDGVIVLDADQRITFASPNAVNALHRMGILSTIIGSSFPSLGLPLDGIELALTNRLPVTEEVERRPEVIMLVRAIPLVEEGAITGAAVLVRDVTDLRRRDRMLLSKDAAIREVHHRVKNNLQTISSLLRLQSRRLQDRAAREALNEAERRIRAIALVHEILARESGDQVPFGEIVPALVNLARDAGGAGRRPEMAIHGEPGELSADVATPLAVVIAELLQNAVEHAFGSDCGAGEARGPLVELTFRSGEKVLEAEVRDNGEGFPSGFDLDRTTSLGLAIVRDLVRSQLGGSITIENQAGAVVTLTVPL